MINSRIKVLMVCTLLWMGTSIHYTYAFDKPKEIGWRVLQQLDYRTGKASNQLNELNGKMVRLPGFIVPLEGDQDKITKFLLVPTFGACIHVPPPPPNQTVYVEMPQGITDDMLFYAVWVSGQLHISTTRSIVLGTDYTPEANYKIDGIEVMFYDE